MSEPSQVKRAALESLARGVGTMVVLFGGLAVLPLRGELWWLGAAIGTLLLAGTVPLAVRRLRAVLASDRPVFEAFEALVLLFSMLVTGFAAVYYAMNRTESQFVGLDTRIDAVYFTVTTLSTVGFGDIAATGQEARLVVTLQILFDLVFIGVAVRVFMTAVRERSQHSPGRPGAPGA